MKNEITLATYNLHKGLSYLNRRVIVHEVRQRLHRLSPDLVFLQEVQGAHHIRNKRFTDWPTQPQHEHIAEGRWVEAIYGLNAEYRHGHHGNAILSAFPVSRWKNYDVSHHRFERRGHLHVALQIPHREGLLHAVCVHLGLWQKSRETQIRHLLDQVHEEVPADAPLIVAGDFNDWRCRRSGISALLSRELGLIEAFESAHGAPARTFPAAFPVLTLDRIYVRGLDVVEATRLHGETEGGGWRGLSDHAGLIARLRLR